jgi:hypothetical protein
MNTLKHLEKYYEGKGCKCFARSSNECGCHDVDWTPKAVYELRAERDSLQIALEEISNLAKTLKAERDEAREELHDIRLNLGADAEGYTLIHAVCVLQQERDEARADRNCLHDLHNKNAIHFKELLDLCATLRQKRDEAREAFKEMWRSGDAFLPHVDSETINRWRKAAGWEESK